MSIYARMPLAFWGLTTKAWIFMWAVLGFSTIALVILLRTRWLRQQTWRRCAILSLWVHLLIVVFSMTVRVVVGPPNSDEGGPIRVAVLPAVPISQSKEATLTEEIAPVWEDLSAPALVAPAADPLPANEVVDQQVPDTGVMDAITEILAAAEPLARASDLATPELMPQLMQDETKADSVAEEPEQISVYREAQPLLVNDQKYDTGPNQDSKADSKHSDSLPVESASGDPIPNLYANRFVDDLTELATERGGSSQTEAAVKAALGWLAANQSENGGWDASRYDAGEERVILGHNRQGAGRDADMGVTGLAILAFLGSGHSHLHGSYRAEVAKALEFLRKRQRADGSLYDDAELFARTYCHSMATLAACEAYAMTRDQRLESMCRAAVAYTLAMQHPSDGGWRYRRGDTGDTSQLGWVLMALKSAKLAGIEVPDITWTRAGRFLRRVKRGTHGGLAAYRPDGPPSRTMTAEALFCHQLIDVYSGRSLDSAAIREAIISLGEELPSTRNRNLYYWYYATLALQQNQHQSPEDTESWNNWNHALTTALLATQESDGSWNTDTVWGGYGGRVYTTALSALCLEVYYRYNPVTDLANRKGWQSLQR